MLCCSFLISILVFPVFIYIIRLAFSCIQYEYVHPQQRCHRYANYSTFVNISSA